MDAGTAPTLEERLLALEEENRTLNQRLGALESQTEETSKQLSDLLPLKTRLTGYVDLGFFWVRGDGSGIRTDVGYQHFPQFRGQVPDSWVFMGDPLSTAVNFRNEPADTGESRAVTFDPINAGNKPGFILNAFGLVLFAGLGERLSATAMLDIVPRSRDVSMGGVFLGDFVDLKLAYLEWLAPLDFAAISISAGKLDSVLGIEYRGQDPMDRLTVSPSLICRYTCGRPLGLKVRAVFFDDLSVMLALTNGAHFIEMFPLFNEIDRNTFKTGAGRLAWRFPLGSGLEIGISGAIGAQDNQPDDGVPQWHWGADVKLAIRDFTFAAEFVKGRAEGKTEPRGAKCGLAQCLDYKGAYGLVSYRLTNWLAPYARVDWREALHLSGASFAYVSNVMRATAGLHVELGEHVVVKAEYVVNLELPPLPQFDDDFFTSSLVVKL